MRTPTRCGTALLGGTGLVLLALSATALGASSPAGEWMVANGKAIMRVVDCRGQYWGLVAWEQSPGGVDVNNPNPSLRTRSTLGMPVLLGMAPAGGQATWSGRIYNSQDGRTYDGRIRLAGPDTLHVEGCVLGFLCGGEDWRRVSGAHAVRTR